MAHDHEWATLTRLQTLFHNQTKTRDCSKVRWNYGVRAWRCNVTVIMWNLISKIQSLKLNDMQEQDETEIPAEPWGGWSWEQQIISSHRVWLWAGHSHFASACKKGGSTIICRRMLRLSYVVSLSVLMLEAAALEGRADPISQFNPHPQTTYTGAISENMELALSDLLIA